MKISNRSLSLVLVVCLLLLAMPPGGAGAYVNEDKAQRLHELGLYSGIDPQVFTPDLGGSIDRQTGLAMIVKLFGHEAEALALSEIEISQALAPFPDAGDVAPWARPYVAWAIINNIATGLPDGRLAPLEPFNGLSLATQILRQLGYWPNYHGSLLDLSLLGALSPEDAQRLQRAAMIRDDMVGISYGALGLHTNAGQGLTLVELLEQQGLIQPTGFSCPAQLDAIVGQQTVLAVGDLPAGAIVSQECGNNQVLEVLRIENTTDGISNIVFMPLQSGIAQITVTVTPPTGLPMSQTVTVTVRDSAFVSGPGYPVNVAPGTHSATIQVFPADALVTAESSDSSILKVLSISPDGEQRTLSFQGLKAGECKIRLNASKTGFAPATAEITVNVTKQIVIGGLKDSYDLGSGAQEIPFKLNPSSASLSVECDDSSLVTSLAVTGSGAERRLVFSTHGTGSCFITLTASCEGYNGASRSIAINTTADWISDSSPPAVAINGLNDVTVPVETVKYIPFTTSPADAALSVSVVNPGGTEVLTVPCPSPITMGNTRFLVVLPNAQGTAQVTVMASSPGWSGSSQTINVTAADPSGAKLGPEFAEGQLVTGSTIVFDPVAFTVSPATVQVSTYYENIDPNVIQSATVSGSTLSVNRELLIDPDNAGDAQVIIVGRLNEFLDSLLLNIEVL